MPRPSLYTHSAIVWGAPDALPTTQDVIRISQRHIGVTWSLERSFDRVRRGGERTSFIQRDGEGECCLPSERWAHPRKAGSGVARSMLNPTYAAQLVQQEFQC